MKNKKTKTLVLSMLALVFATVAQAQVRGTVFESGTGEPIIGASILEVGTTNGVITDFDGNFELNVQEGANLQISYMGFQTQTLPAKNGMVVKLAEDAIQIQEVVAIGYGSQKKKEVTGSVASVKAEDFNAGVKSNPIGLIQGKVPGLNVINTTSDPTQGGFKVQIRGFSTLDKGAGTDPLYIVDGVPVSSIDNISPDEIASMDVLKDGSAAAIYGTRGTNGVILITTKRGEGFSDEPKTQVEYSGYVSCAWVNSSTGMATADEFRDLPAKTNGGIMSIKDGGASTDWMSYLVRRAAVTHSHNIAITGSHRKFNYRASVGYKKAEGIAKNNSREEILAKIAAQQKALNGWLDLQYDFSYMHYRNDYFCGDFKQAAIMNPTYPVYDASTPSGYYKPTETGASNPVELMNNKESYQDGNYFRGSIKATINIKAVEGLKFNAFAAIEEGDNRSYSYTGTINTDVSGSNKATRSNSMNFSQLYEVTADYAHSFGHHTLVGVLGFSYQNFFYDGSNMENGGFPTQSMKYYMLGNGSADKANMNIGSYRNSNSLAAFFARVNYNYKEKYLLSASLRAEGSSRFGKNNKWGWFPAVSAGWRIKGEQFMMDQDWCNELKLRLGFGITGNNLGSDLKSIALLSNMGTMLQNGQYVYTYGVAQNVNADLRWERKFEYNLGIDYAFLDNRLYGSFDVYLRDTKDLLWDYEVPTPPYQYSTMLANAGQMRSYGVELAISGVPVKTKNWNWTSTATLAWNHCKVVKLSDPDHGFNYTTTTTGGVGENGIMNVKTQLLQEGESIGAFYGYQFAGFQSDGTAMYETPAGRYTSIPTDNYLQTIGSAQPAVTYGWTNTVRYKDLDISIFFRGVLGNKILNVTRWAYGPIATKEQQTNVFMYDIKKNPHNNPAGTTYMEKAYLSSYLLEDGSFLKLDNITVGYTFRFKENKYVNSLRMYTTFQNLFTISSYSGQDPEINTADIWSAGIDGVSFYPRTASWMFGVNLNLF